MLSQQRRPFTPPAVLQGVRICLHTCFHGSTEILHAFGGSRSRDSSFSVFSCPGPRSGVNSATRSPPQRLQSLALRGSRVRPTENRSRRRARPPRLSRRPAPARLRHWPARLLTSPRPSLCARGAPPFRRRCQDDGASLAAQPTPGPACSAQSRCFRGPRPAPGPARPGPARHDSAPPRPAPPLPARGEKQSRGDDVAGAWPGVADSGDGGKGAITATDSSPAGWVGPGPGRASLSLP